MHLVCACQCPAVTDREFENGDVVFGELLRKTGSDSQIVECQRVPRSISHTHDFKSVTAPHGLPSQPAAAPAAPPPPQAAATAPW
jgi:hypothetical protein